MPTPKSKNPQELDLRNRFQALMSSHSFEEVAAAYSVDDLEFLLTDTKTHPAKSTYLYDSKDALHGAVLRQWVNAGVLAYLARAAIKSGYTADTLHEAADLAVAMGPSRSHDGWLDTIAKCSRPLQFIKDCASAEFDGPWLDAGLASGADVGMLQDLRRLGVPPRFAISGIVMSCANAEAVIQWFQAGISPWSAAHFIKVELAASDALAWLRASFVPEEIVECVKAGKTLDASKAQQLNVAHSKVFRRRGDQFFGIAGPYKARVREAVGALDAERKYQSSMFSSAREEWSFLDGGYVSSSGYGFGSHSSSNIKGEKALRFICFRIGVQPPRSHPGSEDPGQEDLEKEFLTQRIAAL